MDLCRRLVPAEVRGGADDAVVLAAIELAPRWLERLQFVIDAFDVGEFEAGVRLTALHQTPRTSTIEFVAALVDQTQPPASDPVAVAQWFAQTIAGTSHEDRDAIRELARTIAQ